MRAPKHKYTETVHLAAVRDQLYPSPSYWGGRPVQPLGETKSVLTLPGVHAVATSHPLAELAAVTLAGISNDEYQINGEGTIYTPEMAFDQPFVERLQSVAIAESLNIAAQTANALMEMSEEIRSAISDLRGANNFRLLIENLEAALDQIALEIIAIGSPTSTMFGIEFEQGAASDIYRMVGTPLLSFDFPEFLKSAAYLKRKQDAEKKA